MKLELKLNAEPDKPDFRRLANTADGKIQLMHPDGKMTVFGTSAAYEIFKQGLLNHTTYVIYDTVLNYWIKGNPK